MGSVTLGFLSRPKTEFSEEVVDEEGRQAGRLGCLVSSWGTSGELEEREQQGWGAGSSYVSLTLVYNDSEYNSKCHWFNHHTWRNKLASGWRRDRERIAEVDESTISPVAMMRSHLHLSLARIPYKHFYNACHITFTLSTSLWLTFISRGGLHRVLESSYARKATGQWLLFTTALLHLWV